MKAAHAAEARLEAPLALLAPGCGEPVERRVARQAEDVIATQLAQQIQHFRGAVVTVAAHQNGDLRPTTADAVDDMGEHARDLLPRRPLAGPQEREDRLARIALENVDRLKAVTARMRIEGRQLL